MRTRIPGIATLVALGAVAALWRVGAPSDRDDRAPSFHAAAPGVVLLDLRDNLAAAEREALLATIEGETLNSAFANDEWIYRVTLDAAAIARLAGDPRVEGIESDATYTTFGAGPSEPNDPLYAFQWHLDQIEVEGAWKHADGEGVVVAVIDTGVAWGTRGDPSLRGVADLGGTGFVPGYDFVDDDDDPFDLHGHGTHVAGTIAQTTNNAYGVAGIAPAARIMPLRVLDAEGRGSTADIADAIRFAANNGAHIINMSLGGPLPSRILADSIQYARSRGVVVIAAAGNSGSSVPSYPAAYPGVISVAATQYDRTATFYSNWGRHLDIAAPGGNVRVDQNGDGRPDGVLQETLARGNPREHEFALYMGTSMAAPHVAGVAALVRSQGVTHPDRIEEIVLRTADSSGGAGDPMRYGAGIVHAERAAIASAHGDHVPRSGMALLLTLALASLAGAQGRVLRIAAGTSALAAGGLAWLAAPLGWMGVGAGLFGTTSGPLFGLMDAAPAWLASSALWQSALPIAAVYALAGGLRGSVSRGVVVGTMSGLSAVLFAAAFAPRADLLGVPGMGGLDAMWLAANGLIGAVMVWAAMRPDSSTSAA